LANLLSPLIPLWRGVLVSTRDRTQLLRGRGRIGEDNTMWMCPKCSRELAVDFDACWKCGTRRSDTRCSSSGKGRNQFVSDHHRLKREVQVTAFLEHLTGCIGCLSFIGLASTDIAPVQGECTGERACPQDCYGRDRSGLGVRAIRGQQDQSIGGRREGPPLRSHGM